MSTTQRTPPLRALEFYSGIGGMHYSLLQAGVSAKVVEAFDINDVANDVYMHNFGTRPNQGNVQRFSAQDFDKYGADIWLMSPPCQPYTRQGLKKDAADGRATSFLGVLDKFKEMKRPPSFLFVENVVGFETSVTHECLMEVLHGAQFSVQEFILSPLQFGIPYSRPRYFCLAKRHPHAFSAPELSNKLNHTCPPVALRLIGTPASLERSAISEIVNDTLNGILPPFQDPVISPEEMLPPVRSVEIPNSGWSVVEQLSTRMHPELANADVMTAQHGEEVAAVTAGGGRDDVACIRPLREFLELGPLGVGVETKCALSSSTLKSDQRFAVSTSAEGAREDHVRSCETTLNVTPAHSGSTLTSVGGAGGGRNAGAQSTLRKSENAEVDQRGVAGRMRVTGGSCEIVPAGGGRSCCGEVTEGDDNKWRDYWVPEDVILRFSDAMDIVSADARRCCCFTKSYFRYVKGTGSVLATKSMDANGRAGKISDNNRTVAGPALPNGVPLMSLGLRYFTPREVANIHSLPPTFEFPAHVTQRQRYALLGNSMSIAVVAPLLHYLLSPP